MSFTVTRYRDGKATPIKLSIWDAFKGVPNLKPKPPKPCSCCNKVHPKKPRQGKPKQASTWTTPQGGSKPSQYATHHPETYSEEDDAKIIDMKAAHKSWKDILAATNKQSLSQLKEHWKTINPQRRDNSTEGNQPVSNEAKKAEIERQKAEGQARKRKTRAEEASANPAVTLGSLQSGPSGTPDAGSAAGTHDLRSFADRYERYKWIAAASKHFDLTGERISPAKARQIAEGS